MAQEIIACLTKGFMLYFSKNQEVANMTEITKNIRRFRKKLGLSQNELAERLHVARQTVSSWETGKTFPDLDMVIQLSDVLQTDPNSLLYPAADKIRKPYRAVSFKFVLVTLLVFFLLMTFGSGIFVMLFSSICGGGVAETFLYPIYGGIIFLAGLVVLCTCVILDELRNASYYEDAGD